MMEAARSPEEELSLTNCALVNQNDLQSGQHVVVKMGERSFVFTVKTHQTVSPGTIALNLSQRQWVGLLIGQDVKVCNYTFDESTQSIGVITIEIDFLQKKKKTVDTFPYDSDKMAAAFIQQFKYQAFSVTQQLVFSYCNKLFGLVVKEMEAIHANILRGEPMSEYEQQKIEVGLLVGNSQVIFEKRANSSLTLVGKAKTIDWDLEKLGMGLSQEFCDNFRKIFNSRVIPPVVVDVLGLRHVKSILLFGPPGCGKTLLARLIGTMLNARLLEAVEVGESEIDIHGLIAAAVEEQQILGANSGLHIIVFDDVDGFCSRGGSEDYDSGAAPDSVVNQLLCGMDMEQLNNILVIGTTSRIDLLDDTLMRPGRFEVHVKIGLPDEKGRQQILMIHTEKMRRYKFLAGDVDVKELAAITENFSGAELEGLIRAAQSYALTRFLQSSAVMEVDPDQLQITRADFLTSLSNKDVTAGFGKNPEDFSSSITSDIINWESGVAQVSVENPEDSSAAILEFEGDNPSVSAENPEDPSSSFMSVVVKPDPDQ